LSAGAAEKHSAIQLCCVLNVIENMWAIFIPLLILLVAIGGLIGVVMVFQSMLERLNNFLEGKREL